jgi:predicted AAA+ superfamily ATPase
MRAWYEVIKPREDILSGELDEAIFAANLADVLQGRAPLEYRDPHTSSSRPTPRRDW